MDPQLDAPGDDESLYLIADEVVDDLRPINQGDVYRGITLPGFPESDHDLILLATHPCSLRAGATLKPRLQAAPVRRSKRIAPEAWRLSYLRQMPLPSLLNQQAYAAALTECSLVTPDHLAAAERIAALSEEGILLLQQRLVWALTHAVVSQDTLAEYSAPAFAEIELLEEWNRGLCSIQDQDRVLRLAQIATAFEEFIRESGLQTDLADEKRRGDARRRIRDELSRRLTGDE